MAGTKLARIDFDGRTVGQTFRARIKTYSNEVVAVAAVNAAKRAGEEFLKRGRMNMLAGGNFGSPRWQNSLGYQVIPAGGALTIKVTDNVSFWRVFEYGATIHGQPLLWIPLSFAGIPKGQRARDYGGDLFRVNREGKAPLLLDAATKEPKYFGKESVTIPKKWNLREVAGQVMRQEFPRYFREEVAKLKKPRLK